MDPGEREGGATAAGAVDEYRTAVRDSTRLTRLFGILSEPAPLEPLLDRLLLALSELFAADVVAVLRPLGPEGLAPLWAIGLPEDPTLPPFSGAPGSLSVEVARSGLPAVVAPGLPEPRLDAPLLRLGVEAAVFLPAPGSREVQGVLVLARCQPLPFARADVDLLAAMAHRVGLVLERARADEERRLLEARLAQAQKAESLGRMAGAIAHRFNNQLGAAMGHLEAAAADLPRDAAAREDLARALEALREAAQVSGHMLAYLGQASGAREPVDLAAVCREALAGLLPSLPRTVRLRSTLPAAPLAMRGDATSLRGLLASLVVNAWEAITGEAGDIEVTLRPVPAAEVRASPLSAPGWRPTAAAYACLEVRDTGCGMDAAGLQNAFDPFFTTKFAGRGLGLPVALGTVRAHEGSIEAESVPGRGSVFRVYLPLAPDARPPERAEAAAAPGPGRRTGLALAVDDEPSMRRAVERLLRKMGYQVLTAADGVEALEVFRSRAADISLVLLDLTMPRMDGWQALQAIRALSPGTPVVLASGYDEAQVMGGRPPEHSPVFLKKPFSWDELEAAIDRAVREARRG